MSDDAIARIVRERGDEARTKAHAAERRFFLDHPHLRPDQLDSKEVLADRVGVEAAYALSRLSEADPPFAGGEVIDNYDFWGRKSDSWVIWSLELRMKARPFLLRATYDFYLSSVGAVVCRSTRFPSANPIHADVRSFRRGELQTLIRVLRDFPSA